ncbi:MAG: helix-turn-helix transcriptional regulator, partial [Burkholderiales bacterium]|nr:helix-turn-helix transcriptional regulator [Burkholderiales bacterium]
MPTHKPAGKSVPKTPTRASRARREPTQATGAAAPAPRRAERPGLGSLLTLARQLRSWTDSMIALAGPATDMAVAAVAARTGDAKQRATIHKAGAVLRAMRESAGLSLQDLGRALDLRDPALLESAEGGAIALPFEVVLRLAAVLGRDDPVTAMMRLTRAYNPDLWKTLEQLGFGRLVVQAGRERELANLYRANDDARRLDDAEFDRVLEFTRQAFDMAVAFRTSAKTR